LRCFRAGDEEWLAAPNQLLEEHLIRGRKAEEVRGVDRSQGRMAIALNSERLKDIIDPLKPWYRDTRFLITSAIAIASLFWAILSTLLLKSSR